MQITPSTSSATCKNNIIYASDTIVTGNLAKNGFCKAESEAEWQRS